MSKYVTKLKNFPENPFTENYVHTNLEYELQTIDLLNKEVINIFNELNISTDKISIFRSTDFCEHQIHRDNHNLTDMAKLIWMWGDHHEMIWYNIKDGIEKTYGKKLGPSGVSSSYINYAKNDVDIIHKETIKGPSLIQVGPPHNVINYSGKRISFTVVPFLISKNKKLIKPLTYNEALIIFQKFL